MCNITISSKKENCSWDPLPYPKKVQSPVRKLFVGPYSKWSAGPNKKIVSEDLYSTKMKYWAPLENCLWSHLLYKKKVQGQIRKYFVGHLLYKKEVQSLIRKFKVGSSTLKKEVKGPIWKLLVRPFTLQNHLKING